MTGTIQLVVATTNPKKIEEIARLVPDWVQLVPRPNEVGDVEESAPTLEGNAYIKAVEIANYVRDWAIADDTGLFVDALGGAPGVHTSRYGGPQSNDEQNRKNCRIKRKFLRFEVRRFFFVLNEKKRYRFRLD